MRGFYNLCEIVVVFKSATITSKPSVTQTLFNESLAFLVEDGHAQPLLPLPRQMHHKISMVHVGYCDSIGEMSLESHKQKM